MLERRTPLESMPEGLMPDGLHLAAVRDRGLLLLQSASSPAMQQALERELGLPLPAAQQVTALGEYALLWLAPGQWLLDLPAKMTASIETALGGRLEATLAAVTDLSDALISLELGGALAPEILMSGCSVDLRPHAFPPGCLARTALAAVPAILWNPGAPERIRCLIECAFADHMLSWLRSATRR
jgi:sarcosine oxidase subunit gamma